MLFEFRFPDVGEGIREGRLVSWNVKEGDSVAADQPLCEVETDKAVVELPSPEKGVARQLRFKSGDTVKVGETLVVLEVEDGSRASAAQPATTTTAVAVGGISGKSQPQLQNMLPSETRILPRDRKFAKELGVDITRARGTGPKGRITRQDVEAVRGIASILFGKAAAEIPLPRVPGAVRAPPSVRRLAAELGVSVEQALRASGRAADVYRAAAGATADEERVKIEGVRAIIKKRMEASWRTVPHAAVAVEVDADRLAAAREKTKEALEQKGIKLTYLAYIVKAAAAALEEFPRFNSSIDEATQEFVLKKQINIGIAVDTDYGLVVPNIKNCNNKPVAEIAREIQELAQKARDRRLQPGEVTGGTFSITNVGSFGAIGGAGVINYPECSILMVGSITDKVVIVDGKAAAKKVLPLQLTFDHRIVDGADAGRFLHFTAQQLRSVEEVA